jgi:hypothetical protein
MFPSGAEHLSPQYQAQFEAAINHLKAVGGEQVKWAFEIDG